MISFSLISLQMGHWAKSSCLLGALLASCCCMVAFSAAEDQPKADTPSNVPFKDFTDDGELLESFLHEGNWWFLYSICFWLSDFLYASLYACMSGSTHTHTCKHTKLIPQWFQGKNLLLLLTRRENVGSLLFHLFFKTWSHDYPVVMSWKIGERSGFLHFHSWE